ncbi:hypothetical protein [Acidiplasma cupricumulans]|nr:hypothetical protein [Acidiplasma cupricumulans]
MGGWAIGWLIAAVFFMFLKSWSLVSLIGIVFVPAIIFSKKHNVISPLVKKFQFDFSFKIFILFILGFTPAYILEVVPSFLGSASLYESIIAYSFAVPAYIILPYLINRISIYKIFYASVVIVSLSGIIFFLTDDIVLAVIFTVFGLGMISLLPIISRNLNVEPKK